MTAPIVDRPDVQALLDRISGVDEAAGDARLKQIVRHIVTDLYTTIERFEITPEEFWATLGFFQDGAREFGLIAPGLGFDHFLDLRMDEADAAAGLAGATPRTIEGPLYLAGAPISTGYARLDTDPDDGETLIVQGRVLDVDGTPVADAIVDVWQANTLGNYSHFDPSQSAYNNRRRIRTEADGAYAFRAIVPSGYAVPAQGATERLLARLGRHGNRPAHIHFFVSAPGRRHLTSQINIDGDPYLHDDFAQATRDDLIPEIVRHDAPDAMLASKVNGPFAEIRFDFTLARARDEADTQLHPRPRVAALA